MVTCSYCGKSFASKVRIRDNKILRKFCSQKCVTLHKINPHRTNDYPIDWGDIKETIKMRSKNLCELCGRSAKIVHHKIKPAYFKINPINAHNPDNLIHLCYSCHTVIERREWRGWNKHTQSPL